MGNSKIKITRLEQYEFYKDIAFSKDPTVPWNVKMQAFENLCELCGTPNENARKWVIELRTGKA